METRAVKRRKILECSLPEQKLPNNILNIFPDEVLRNVFQWLGINSSHFTVTKKLQEMHLTTYFDRLAEAKNESEGSINLGLLKKLMALFPQNQVLLILKEIEELRFPAYLSGEKALESLLPIALLTNKKIPAILEPHKEDLKASITHFFINKQQMEKLLDTASSYPNLTDLFFEDEKAVFISGRIGILKNLKSLTIVAHKLKEIPKEIKDLLSLEQLFVASDKLTAFPLEVKELQNLIDFEVDCENLDEQWLDDFILEITQNTLGHSNLTD